MVFFLADKQKTALCVSVISLPGLAAKLASASPSVELAQRSQCHTERAAFQTPKTCLWDSTRGCQHAFLFGMCVFVDFMGFPCLCKRGKPRGLGCINAANFNFVVGFVTILGICLTEQKALHRHTQAPARTKALVAFYVIIHQVFDMNLPLSSHSVRRKKNNWAHYLSSLWHIRFIIFLQRLPVWVM